MPHGKETNFDFLRLAAALLLWYGQCFSLTGRGGFVAISPFENPASLGVAITFVISGYFITQSYERHDRLIEFLWNRALRVLVPLLGLIAFCVVVVGPLATTLPLSGYFRHSDTWEFWRALLIFNAPAELPGTFTTLPSHNTTNAPSLLAPLVRWYLILAVIGALGILTTRFMKLLALACAAVLVCAAFMGGHTPESVLGFRFGMLLAMAQYGLLFCGGAYVYMIRNAVPRHVGLLTASILLVIFSAKLPGLWGVIPVDIALIYTVIYLGFHAFPVVKHAARYGDISYGVFLYAYPVQQLCLHFMRMPAPMAYFIPLSLSGTLLCAFLSWHVLEKRMLRWKY